VGNLGRTINRASTNRPVFNTMSRNGLRLLTLGHLDLVRGTGEAADASLSTRRRKLALLAVLAVHRRPIARDTLLEYFWGDQDEAKARHSLSDTLSHLRRVLGREAIVTTPTSAALASDDGLLDVDALEFVAAVQRNDAAAAIELYKGPFLDGLGRGTSAAFEQWLDGVRSQFDRRFALACEQRCTELADAAAWDECAEIATRWQVRDPASSGAMHFQLRAMAAPGNREAALAALRTFDRYRARLADDFGMRPDQALADFAAELADRVRVSDAKVGTTSEFAALLRTGPQRAVKPVDDTDPKLAAAALEESLHAVAPADVAPARATPAEIAPPTTAPLRDKPTARRWWRSRTTLLSVALFVTAIVVAVKKEYISVSVTSSDENRATSGTKPLIAFTDIRLVRGDSAELWITDGLAQLIAASLARSASLDVVTPARVRDATLRAELDPNRLDADAALLVARSVQADLLVRGGLVHGDTLLLLDLTVTDAKTGNTVEVLAAQGRDLVTLASAASARIADVTGGSVPGPRVADLETPSAEAFERYMRALRLMDGLSIDGAAAELDAAIAIDSGFVSALVERLGIANSRGETQTAARLSEQIDKNAYRASAWVRLLREADQARGQGDTRRTLTLLQELVARHPRDPRAYSHLAGLYGHLGDFAKAESVTVVQLSLDSLATTVGRGPCAACAAYGGLRMWLTLSGDLQGALVASRRICELQPELPGAWIGLMESAAILRDSVEADRAWGRLLSLIGQPDANLRAGYARMQLLLRQFDLADSVLLSLERDPDRLARIVGHDVRAIYWRELGDWSRANAALDRWEKEGADRYVANMMRGNSLSRLGLYAEAERAYRELLVTLPREPIGEWSRMSSWITANMADAIAPSGDTVKLKQLADSVEFFSRRSYYTRDAHLPYHIRGLVAVQGNRLAEARDLFAKARWGAHGCSTNLVIALVRNRCVAMRSARTWMPWDVTSRALRSCASSVSQTLRPQPRSERE
jgi:DNA-binding SARP family transcriptional activator/TolB-like protein